MSSQFEEQSDDLNAVCPYCQYSYQVEAEDYSEDRRLEVCGECTKTFWIEQSFSVTTHTKPDCAVNGEKHTWILHDLSNGSAFFCAICNKISLLAEDGTPAWEAQS